MPIGPLHSETPGSDDEIVMTLVEQALREAPRDREAWIRQTCAGDVPLFEMVLSYVRWDERMRNFLAEPVYSLLDWTPTAEPELQPGHTLENRFRIVRKIASGGMGVVYEAWDEKLARRIAIKCALRGFQGRLPPEVRHASEINHPNVCKTWEIHTASGPEEGFDFFTMEFIEGRTLAERLREGILPLRQARVIAGQICEGLAEAHRHEVIHGDLKSNNILIAEGPDGLRAVITDFGLARLRSTGGCGTMSGEIGGTPNYMAPELWHGARSSAASDIYALGVILHEMASGRQPFETTASVSERATRRPLPFKHPWSRVIARCLEPDPAHRVRSVEEVARTLIPLPWLRWSAIAAVVLIAASMGALAYRSVGVSREAIRLAVLPFTADTETRSLSDGLAQDAADRLRGITDTRRKLVVIPIRDAVRNKVAAPSEAAARLGATHVLAVTLKRHDGRIGIHASLTDARSLLELKGWDAEYQPSELRQLPVALAGVVTGTLRFKPLATASTVKGAAYADFSTGVGLLQREEIERALPFLSRAVVEDPDSPLTHARLAEAQAAQYQFSPDPMWLETAAASLHKAQERDPDLGLVWLVSARIHQYQGHYEAAESDLERALEINPRDGDAWRRLGRVYEDSSRFSEALVAYKKAIETQPDYFLNYQVLCGMHIYQADYDDAIRECGTVVQLVPELSEAHVALAIPLFCHGDYRDAEAEFRKAIALDHASTTAIYSYAFALTSQGRATEAIPLFQRALQTGEPTYLLYSDFGTAYRLAGQVQASSQAYNSGLQLAEKALENNPRDAVLKARTAFLCARVGERTRAISEANQAMQLSPNSVEVAWWVVLTWEALAKWDDALAVLRHVPDDTLRRLARESDLADFRASSRFQELLQSRHLR
jgi:eukaryotic-like serine/threonine-protein kinase